jgi:hypothetical protein
MLLRTNNLSLPTQGGTAQREYVKIFEDLLPADLEIAINVFIEILRLEEQVWNIVTETVHLSTNQQHEHTVLLRIISFGTLGPGWPKPITP